MQYSTFLQHVEREAGLRSRDEAERIALAFMRTLGDRLTGGEVGDIFEQLPQELLLKQPEHTPAGGQDFGLDEFLARVSREAQVQVDLLRACRAVMLALQAALSPGEIWDMRAQLPREYDTLFRVEERAAGA